MEQQKRHKWYYSQIDSIRGLSFLAVFFYHTIKFNEAGSGTQRFIVYIRDHLYLGLDVFFVLSAFLLTWLGLNEYQKNESFSFKNYFLRRILRIWPLYYLIMIFAFVLLPLMGKYFHVSISLPPPAWYLFFVSNFYYIDHVFFLRMLWTISVEEQFYLVLGICLKFISRYLVLVFSALLTISIGFSVYAILYNASSYTHTLTYFFNFSVGGLAAIVLYRNRSLIKLLSGFSRIGTIFFYLYLPIHFSVFYLIDNKVSDLLSRYLFIIYISVLLVEQIVNKNRSGFLERNKFLIFTGKISFGLYCFHGITITFIDILFPQMAQMIVWLRVLLIFGINYGIATLSYYYFESPFLRLKERLRNS